VSASELVPLSQVGAAELDRCVVRCAVPAAVAPPFSATPPHAFLVERVRASLAAADARAAAVVRDGELAGLCVLRAPAWDRGHFGFGIGRLEHLFAADPEAASAAVEWACAELTEIGVRMCAARVTVEDLVVIGALQRAGFTFQEQMVLPWRRLDTWEHRGFGASRLTEPDDVPEMCRIARAAFRTDHFHTDPRFEGAAADGVYERWIRSWHETPPYGARSRVLLVEGRVAGFFMYRVEEPSPALNNVRTADLVLGSVDPQHAGKGLGWLLYCDTVDDLKPRADLVHVLVVTRNAAVVNLYMKLGFRFSAGGQVTLHRWSA
jgi:ribosomal protein S18 acetylase RimI-like enzyme